MKTKNAEEEKVTLNSLREIGNIPNAIDWAQNQFGTYPQRPSKPSLASKHTADDVKIYLAKLSIWEEKMVEHDEQMIVYKNAKGKIIDTIVEFIKDEAGFDFVPDKYKEKVYEYAYSEGHSYGYYEVFLKLNSLVYIFE